jgi:hypothetical protein
VEDPHGGRWDHLCHHFNQRNRRLQARPDPQIRLGDAEPGIIELGFVIPVVGHRMKGIGKGEPVSSGALGERDGHDSNVLHNLAICYADGRPKLAGVRQNSRPRIFLDPRKQDWQRSS